MYLKSYSNLIWFIFECGFEIGKENRKGILNFFPLPTRHLARSALLLLEAQQHSAASAPASTRDAQAEAPTSQPSKAAQARAHLSLSL